MMNVSFLQQFSLALCALHSGEDLPYFMKFKCFWQLKLQFVVLKLEMFKCFQIML